jgi:hypothetical protein
MTLSDGRPRFKTCPNCKGDGFEDSPPLRRCWTCKGTGKVWEKGPIKHRRERKFNPSAPKQRPEATGCQRGQEAL